jgi:hypothetical protein
MTTKLATVEEVADATAGVPDGVAVPGSGAAVVAAAVVTPGVGVGVHAPDTKSKPVLHDVATLLVAPINEVNAVHVTVAALATGEHK